MLIYALLFDHACDRGPRQVTFTSQIELLYGSEDGILSPTSVTHEQLQTWSEKPWTLNVDVNAVVEPLSSLAVSIPTESMTFDVPMNVASCSNVASVHHGQTDGTATSITHDAAQQLPDAAIYDMDSSWLIEMRASWREHASVGDPAEGRIIRVQSWYLHHQGDTRCRQPRTVLLDRMDHLWLSDIRLVWADKLHADEAFHITYVYPQPPGEDDQPFTPHIIVSQGRLPETRGAVFTARFIEEHRTQMIQQAISAPSMMSGTRAVELLDISHMVVGRRWVARSSFLWFNEHELEEIADGLSIIVDVRVPPLESDVTSFAAWNRRNYPPDQPIFELPRVARQGDPLADDDAAIESESSDDNEDVQGTDWRFTHIYRTKRRVYHGHFPWDDAFVFQERASQITGIAEDDIAFCHHVEHRPQDLVAAHTEVLLMQTVADLAIGSVHRLVLVDIEFHEHQPSTDVSVSRRCLSLPHLTQRRTLFRILGLELYCDKSKRKCLMWLNNRLVPQQQQGNLFLEHADYLRVAVPPWPTASSQISTRTCVSQARRPRHRSRSLQAHHDPRHEGGMTDVDTYESQQGGGGVHEDDTSFLQFDVGGFQPFLRPSSSTLASEVAALVRVCSDTDKPTDKIEDEPLERLAEARQQAAQTNAAVQPVPALPPLTQDLLHLYAQQLADQDAAPGPHIYVDTWFCDHERRPHSGVGRVVRLETDITTWFTAIVMAWEDHIDPFHGLSFHIVHPRPAGGDPDVFAHVILLQRANPQMVSTLVSISDTADDPWHPRLMCFTLDRHHLFRDMLALVDLNGVCASPATTCRAWWRDQEIADDWDELLSHGAAILFSIQHDVPWTHSLGGHDDVLDSDDSAQIQEHQPSEAVNLLQTMSKRTQISLAEAIEAPPADVWVNVDCHKALFLREQLKQWPFVCPQYDFENIPWPNVTREALESMRTWTDEIPLRFSFYTDGSALRRHPMATAAVVLIVTTQHGLCWGGYATAECLGEQSAPRAEATALLLAARWCSNLLFGHGYNHVPIEFAFDCVTMAGIAQGRLGSQCNGDLMIVLRALLHWLEGDFQFAFEWTHLRGHCGHPWNEAADFLCHFARQHGPTQHDMPAYHNQCSFDHHDVVPVQWLWLLERSVRQDPFAPILSQRQWRFNIAHPLHAAPDVSLQPIAQRRDVQPQGPRLTISFRLQLATANVLTLFPGQKHASQFLSARAEGLDLQFHETGLHVVGLQETRSRHEGHLQLPHYHILSSPATQRGVGGVQLWVHKKIRDGDVSMDVCPHHLHVLHATAQRLVVRFMCENLRLVFLVLHAPVEADDDTLRAFWKATTAAIPQKYRTWRLFVMADANSRLGSVCSDAVGDWQQVEENMKGHHFHQWLLEHSLFLPQTFQECHRGSGHTWSHATGVTARIDYIACPQVLRDENLETWVDERIDLSLQREDHCCVRAQVPLAFHAKARPVHRPRQPEQRELPWPQWNMDVHTHAATLQTWLGQKMKPTSHLRKKHLTPMTVKLIQAKKFHRHCLGRLRRHRRDAVLRHIFMSWCQR